jgi:hypothetical protein
MAEQSREKEGYLAYVQLCNTGNGMFRSLQEVPLPILFLITDLDPFNQSVPPALL